MPLSRTLKAIFTCSAAALLAGCGAPAPTPGVLETQGSDAGITTDVRAVTRLNDDMDFSEFTTAADPDITCFALTTKYDGTASPSGLYCTPGAPEGTASGQANVAFAATIKNANIYRIEPATRPDLRCYVSGSYYSMTSDGVGSITCLPKAQAQARRAL